MSITTVKITDEQGRRILALEEGHFADLKALDIAPSKLTRTVSAFSNASGGELYVGIDDEEHLGRKVRAWRGFRDIEAANAHLQVFEQLFPLGQYYSYTFLACDIGPGVALQVNVNKTREIMKASGGTPFIRRGAQNLPVTTPDALARLQLDKGITSFESETVDAPADSVTNSVP
ncbi:MAG: ATP-binding protein, partial [Chloroflexota bacterium]